MLFRFLANLEFRFRVSTPEPRWTATYGYTAVRRPATLPPPPLRRRSGRITTPTTTSITPTTSPLRPRRWTAGQARPQAPVTRIQRTSSPARYAGSKCTISFSSRRAKPHPPPKQMKVNDRCECWVLCLRANQLLCILPEYTTSSVRRKVFFLFGDYAWVGFHANFIKN